MRRRIMVETFGGRLYLSGGCFHHGLDINSRVHLYPAAFLGDQVDVFLCEPPCKLLGSP